MTRKNLSDSPWIFLSVVVIILSFLVLTNPSADAVMRWVQKQEHSSNSDEMYTYFRGKSYLLFSIHEIKIEVKYGSYDYATTRTYIGMAKLLIRV